MIAIRLRSILRRTHLRPVCVGLLGMVAAGAHVDLSAAPLPAAGAAFLPATEGAMAVVAGTVQSPQRIDPHGYAATLRIDRVLAGPLAAPATLRLAWEELAPGRPIRFADGDRVVIALAPLPGTSIWQQRFPERADSTAVLTVAGAGNAFVRDPDAQTLGLLATYLTLDQTERGGRDGALALAQLTAAAPPVLALSAIAQLDTIPGLDGKLDAAATDALRRACERRDTAGLPAGIVALAGKRRLAALRPTLTGFAKPGSDLEAVALAALAELDGGLPSAQVEKLLRRRDAAVRAAAVRGARTPLPRQRLARLVRDDPSPLVRSAAVDALLETGGTGATRDILPALSDKDPAVRVHTAQALGAFGEPAVVALTSMMRDGTVTDPTGAIIALDAAGPAGAQALREIAAMHPDQHVRTLARLALGQAPGHEHK